MSLSSKSVFLAQIVHNKGSDVTIVMILQIIY